MIDTLLASIAYGIFFLGLALILMVIALSAVVLFTVGLCILLMVLAGLAWGLSKVCILLVLTASNPSKKARALTLAQSNAYDAKCLFKESWGMLKYMPL